MVIHWSVYFSYLMLPLIFLASDRLLPSPHSSLPPFSQEECQELLRMLHSFDREPSHAMIPDSLTYIPLLDLPAQAVSIVRTRVVSKVLVRVGKFELAYTLHSLTRSIKLHGDKVVSGIKICGGGSTSLQLVFRFFVLRGISLSLLSVLVSLIFSWNDHIIKDSTQKVAYVVMLALCLSSARLLA
jgi:hypothetical protein